jgi:two-component system osmolarity sensor histidine kinase EnvZ
MSRQFTQQIVRLSFLTIHSLNDALLTLPPEKRVEYANKVSTIEGLQLIPPNTETVPQTAQHRLSERQRLLEKQLQERISPEIQMLVEREQDAVPRVWLILPVNHERWIVRWQRRQFDAFLPITAVILLSFSLLIAVVFGWRMVRRINTPLRAVQQHVLRVSDGVYPPPLATNVGPEEIDALNAAVNKMSRDLEKADTDRAILLAGISHDIRTPLARLRLGLELLEAEKPGEIQDLTHDIEEIDSVIGQFLDFARPSDQLKFEEHDLSQIAETVLAQFEARNRAIAHSLTPGLIIPMHESQIRRLITNLLENAWRYGAVPIELHTYSLEDVICLAVLDRGPGIPDNQIERLRQPFTRLEEARSGIAIGSGLGLAIVDRIAASHGAVVDIRNRKGGGLEVRVRFPHRRR